MSLILYLIIVFFVGYWVWKQRERLELNTKSLHKQLLFKLAVIFPLVSSLYFVIWLGAPYPFKFDAHGYNTFLEINKFSLGILALSPILGAFVVYAHRSYQTEIQIKTAGNQLIEAQNKNKVDIYFTRRKFINEQLILFTTTDNEKITHPISLYNRVFYFKDNYEDEINKKFLFELNELICKLGGKFLDVKLYISDYYSENEYKSTDIVLSDFSKKINVVKKKLRINYTSFKLYSVKKESKEGNDNKESRSSLEKELEEAYKIMKAVASYPNKLFMVGSINIISNYIYLLLISVQEVVLILSMGNDIDTLLPDFNKTLSFVKPFEPIDEIGDKLSAENQNPHESS